MISSVLGLALLLFGGTGDPTTLARKGYVACLEQFLVKSLDEKLEPAAYDSSVVPACSAKENILRQAAISADVKAGMKRAASEQMIGEEIADHQATTKERFREYKEMNAKPTLK